MQSKLDELHADFSQLRDDVRVANPSGRKRGRIGSTDSSEHCGTAFKPRTADREWQ